jgi:hypothetical protein
MPSTLQLREVLTTLVSIPASVVYSNFSRSYEPRATKSSFSSCVTRLAETEPFADC